MTEELGEPLLYFTDSLSERLYLNAASLAFPMFALTRLAYSEYASVHSRRQSSGPRGRTRFWVLGNQRPHKWPPGRESFPKSRSTPHVTLPAPQPLLLRPRHL